MATATWQLGTRSNGLFLQALLKHMIQTGEIISNFEMKRTYSLSHNEFLLSIINLKKQKHIPVTSKCTAGLVFHAFSDNTLVLYSVKIC